MTRGKSVGKGKAEREEGWRRGKQGEVRGVPGSDG